MCGEHVLPIAGSRKRERCMLRDLDPVVEHFIVQLCRHLTPFKQRQWFDEITHCESEIAAVTIGTDERADAALDVARASCAKNLAERNDLFLIHCGPNQPSANFLRMLPSAFLVNQPGVCCDRRARSASASNVNKLLPLSSAKSLARSSSKRNDVIVAPLTWRTVFSFCSKHKQNCYRLVATS
jgi:hypothetical protein